MKWVMEHPNDVMPMDLCVRMIVSDWFGEYILSMIEEYVRRINTPANHVDALFFEPKYQVFVFQHNLMLHIMNHRWGDPPLAAPELALYNNAQVSQQFANYIQTYMY